MASGMVGWDRSRMPPAMRRSNHCAMRTELGSCTESQARLFVFGAHRSIVEIVHKKL